MEMEREVRRELWGEIGMGNEVKEGEGQAESEESMLFRRSICYIRG